ncbi:MAG TPA: hypothetical protein VFV49_00640 [Thermoanaerobaculia bacterium]|nr:hypothetical protein [Thermoanaerobaculia bacterium]
MRKVIAALAVVAVVGCSSSSDPTGTKRMNPEILLVQTSSVPTAARHVDSPLTIHYAMRVANNSPEAITLKQVTVQSVSEGAYYVTPTSRPYDVTINPNEKQEVEFWVPARPGGSIVGANGPVTMRVTCSFDSPTGRFQHIVMQRVNERTSITGQQ